MEDWVWYSIFPSIAYACMMIGAILLPFETECALFLSAIAGLGLMFIGIHNAWDTVVYILTAMQEEDNQKNDDAAGP